ncbi:MAG: family 43 glycosylhydrolase [Chloroflexi bacterium]|nr:family 43 glycosylhydrolase [Chloroflexota bacterium]
MIAVDGKYFAYATGNLTYDIQFSTSSDLVTWAPTDEALTKRPFWQPSSSGLTWAPEVAQTSAGFVMYYTARDVQAGKQCLAIAVSAKPEGPFADSSEKPFLCQYDLGGSIDPSPFVDTDGKRYLLWKNDGNCCGMRTRLFMQGLSDDGLQLVGDVKDLGVENDRPWERNLIEGPNLILQDDVYYLFFSANDYNSRNYAAGYATSDTLFGPYKDAAENPILASDETAAGPGGQTMVEVRDGEWWILYHAWDTKRIGDSIGGERSMWLDELVFEGGRVRVEGPDVGPQQAPRA